eukprot:m.16324 g.16324  ORF g.16324 m.16324 type:complete len:236 (+) comp5664_c0_seq1:255-962(+)
MDTTLISTQLLDLPDDILLIILENLFKFPALGNAWPHDEWEKTFSPRSDNDEEDQTSRAQANSGLNFFHDVIINYEAFTSDDFKNFRLTCKRCYTLLDSFSRFSTKLPEIQRYMLVIEKPWSDGSVYKTNSATVQLALEWIDKYDSNELWSPDASPAVSELGLQAISSYPQGNIFDLITVAHKFQHRALREAGCKAIANMIRGKTPREIRATFNIENDIIEEEEPDLRDNPWLNY